MVFENEPRGFKGAESPDWRLHRNPQGEPQTEYVVELPPPRRWIDDRSQTPQGPPAAPPPPPAGYPYPMFAPAPRRTGSPTWYVLSWIAIGGLCLLTLLGALMVITELSIEYGRFDGEVVAANEDIGCDLTVKLGSGQESIVWTVDDCVDAPQIGEQITAYLPVDDEGEALDDRYSDDLDNGYLLGEQPTSMLWVVGALVTVAWLAVGIAAVRYVWVHRMPRR